MKGTFGFDPAACDYGPATGAVRQILTEWAAVDWFVPGGRDPLQAHEVGVRLFREHNQLARTYQPDLFPEEIEIQKARGDWSGFAALSGRVRTPTEWDWKFSALKHLSRRHSQQLGWRLEDQVRGSAGGQRPGDLFLRIGQQVLWAVSPQLNLAECVPPAYLGLAEWYVSYANMDFIECLEWQLAERSDRIDGNPFFPLVRCYGAGCLPFGLGSSTFSLFALIAPLSPYGVGAH